MCLIFLALKQHPDYKLIVVANRDEFYSRKTAPASFWNEYPDLVAGRDLEAFGTWLGLTKKGRISMVTNYRDLKNIIPAAPSRGKLVSDFLMSDTKAEVYLNDVEKKGKLYNGFNLIAGDPSELWYYSNYSSGIQKLTSGFFGLSNHLLDTPWPKVKNGKERFIQLVNSNQTDPEILFDFLYNSDTAPDDKLPDTGLTLDRERALSSMFIKMNGYGSRSSSVILVTNDDRVTFAERVYDIEGFSYTTQTFTFQIGS